MSTRRYHIPSVLLVAALLVSLAAPTPSAGNANGAGNGGNSGGNAGNANGGVGSGNSNAAKRRPSKNVQGGYAIKVAGYYRGSGAVRVSGDAISINATVTDPRGKSYALSSGNLEVFEDRFSGDGTLGDMTVTIDGRVDPQDLQDPADPKNKNKNGVLKNARVTFTFRTHTTPSHRARGAGDLREPG